MRPLILLLFALSLLPARAQDLTVSLQQKSDKPFTSQTSSGADLSLQNMADCPGAPGLLRYTVKETARDDKGVHLALFLGYFDSSNKDPDWAFIRRYFVPWNQPLHDDIVYNFHLSLDAKR